MQHWHDIMSGMLAGLLLQHLLAAALPLKPWVDTTVGIHTFVTFDYGMDASDIIAAAGRSSKYGFVWGSRSKDIWQTTNLSTALRPVSSVPWGAATVRAWYVPFRLDLRPRNLSWFAANGHSEWVMYACDGSTPAWWGDGGPRGPPPGPHWLGQIPVDISNPEVRAQQLLYIDEQLSAPSNRGWPDAIALDGFGLVNGQQCGVRLGNGSFERRYTGRADPKYVADVVDWTEWIASELHKRGLRVLPNVGCADFASAALKWHDPPVLRITNATDGVLDEAGFTIGASLWRDTVSLMLNQQAHQKSYFGVNEFGGEATPPDRKEYWLNTTRAISHATRQLIVALYLLGKQQAAAVEICCTQCYGVGHWLPEFDAAVGTPLALPVLAESPTNISSRHYSNALVLVNAFDASEQGRALRVPLQRGGTDLFGATYAAGSTVTLVPKSGLVLLLNHTRATS